MSKNPKRKRKDFTHANLSKFRDDELFTALQLGVRRVLSLAASADAMLRAAGKARKRGDDADGFMESVSDLTIKLFDEARVLRNWDIKQNFLKGLLEGWY